MEAEWKKKIEDAQKSNEELRRKLEQGSQQLQGEVLELEVEQPLTTTFFHDLIEEVKKGVRGADVIQTVRTSTGISVGKIIWEAKRAEHWSDKWVQKLKDDQQEASRTSGPGYHRDAQGGHGTLHPGRRHLAAPCCTPYGGDAARDATGVAQAAPGQHAVMKRSSNSTTMSPAPPSPNACVPSLSLSQRCSRNLKARKELFKRIWGKTAGTD